MKKGAILIVGAAALAALAALAAVPAGRAEANYIRQHSEAELMREADLVIVADVVEDGVIVNSAHSYHYVDDQNVIHVEGFRQPCVRAHVVRRTKGRSAATILVCTPLHAEASALPARGRRMRMYLQPAGEVWLEVLGGGFREPAAGARRD
jgi:hypothetical protein